MWIWRLIISNKYNQNESDLKDVSDQSTKYSLPKVSRCDIFLLKQICFEDQIFTRCAKLLNKKLPIPDIMF